MNLKGKFFLQFLPSWLIMPFALCIAQVTEVAHRGDFIAAVLVISSIVPIQVYLNEMYVPRAVWYRRRIARKEFFEISVAVLIVSLWALYCLDLSKTDSMIVCIFAQIYVWLSCLSARKILQYQASEQVGGRYSYVFGLIVPITFLILTLLIWALMEAGFNLMGFMYLLIAIPNLLQYFCIRWFEKAKIQEHHEALALQERGLGSWFGYFPIALPMAMVSQHWKFGLVQSADDYAALSVYAIAPFSSLWLIASKSNYFTREHTPPSNWVFWGGPLIVCLTLLVQPKSFTLFFLLALSTQLLSFKFITDLRNRCR